MSIMAKDENTGEDVALDGLLCAGCGSTMAGHTCPGGSFTVTRGAVNHVNAARKGVTRGVKKDKPKCQQCNSVLHYNLGKGLENVLCAYIQMGIHKGIITDPTDTKALKALVPGDGTLTDIDDYSQAAGLKFGKEAKAAGVVTSYSVEKQKEVEQARKELEEARIAAGLPAKEPRVRKPKKNLIETVAGMDLPEGKGDTLEAEVAASLKTIDVTSPVVDGVDAFVTKEKAPKLSQEARKAAASKKRIAAMKERKLTRVK